jgi:hypothetical protein
VAAAPVEVVRPLHGRSARARARHRGESGGDSGPDESEAGFGGRGRTRELGFGGVDNHEERRMVGCDG